MQNNLLIIDDEKNLRELYRDYFKSKGFHVRVARDIKNARKSLQNPNALDLIILDIKLPDGNGFDLLKEIRNHPKNKSVPVILVSSQSIRVDDKVKGFELGADDYLVKPVALEELKARVDRHIRTGRTSIPHSQSQYQSTTLEKILTSAEQQKRNKFVESSQKSKSIVKTWFNHFSTILLTPERILKNENVFWDKYFIGGAALIYAAFKALQFGFHYQSIASGIIGFIAFLALSIGVIAGVAWGIQWVMGLNQISVSYQKTLNSVGVALVPLSLAAFMGFSYVYLGNGQLGDFTIGPLLIFSTQSADTLLGSILRRLDFFEIWSLSLVVLCLSNQLKVTIVKTAMWALACWGIIIVLQGLIKEWISL